MTTQLLSMFAAGCETSNKICLQGLPNPANVANGGIVQTIITVVISIIAAISFLMIAIGGMRYVLSNGDPQGAARARATIIYALVGLVVAIVAQGIVVFIVKRVVQ